jgi:hypothetical protein
MSNRPLEDDDPLPRPPQARAPFPMSPFLIVVIGILVFLLFLSGGFNIYILTNPNDPFREAEEARRREAQERQQQMMVQQDAQTRRMQQEFQQKLADLQRKNEELTRQLEAAKEQADDAKGGNNRPKEDHK